jgi:hypothetical protein
MTMPHSSASIAQALDRERAIVFRSIEEGDAALNRRSNQCDRLLPVSCRTVSMAHFHAAEFENLVSVERLGKVVSRPTSSTAPPTPVSLDEVPSASRMSYHWIERACSLPLFRRDT